VFYLLSNLQKIYFGIIKENFILVIGKIMEKIADKNKVKESNIFLENINIKGYLKMVEEMVMVK
jgi:hypothetical protein